MFLILAFASFVSFPASTYFFAVAGSKLIKRIRLKSFNKAVHMEIGWFDNPKNSSGVVGARLSSDAATVRCLVGYALALVTGLSSWVQMKVTKGFSLDAKIDILKRLQREVFSDLMKLRDRQDKLERLFSIFKSVERSPFLEASTHMTGIVDVAGALLFVESDDQVSFDALDRAGLRTGINSRFSFETSVRQKDTLTAEFVTSQNSLAYHGAASGSPLALAKVMYMANINDWLSVASIPLGARCSDFGSGSKQARGPNRFSSFTPPTFGQYHCCGVGLTVRQPSVEVSFAGLVSGLEMQPDAAGNMSWLSSFGQINYQPFEEARVALSGLWQMPRSSLQMPKLGTLAIPVGGFRRRRESEPQVQSSSTSAGSFALMLDTEFDETTNIGGWVEVQKLKPSLFRWGFSLSDTPEDELGWGLRLGGKVDGHLNQFQLETFLNFNLGKRASLQPVLVYATDGRTRTPALMFRSSWSM